MTQSPPKPESAACGMCLGEPAFQVGTGQSCAKHLAGVLARQLDQVDDVRVVRIIPAVRAEPAGAR